MAKCINCIHDKGIYNNYIHIHEVCEKGHCILCVSNKGEVCEDFKQGKYVPTQEEIDNY